MDKTSLFYRYHLGLRGSKEVKVMVMFDVRYIFMFNMIIKYWV